MGDKRKNGSKQYAAKPRTLIVLRSLTSLGVMKGGTTRPTAKYTRRKSRRSVAMPLYAGMSALLRNLMARV